MIYLTIRVGETQQVRRVEPMRFAEQFAEPEPPPPVPSPARRSRLVPAGLLLVAVVGNLALAGRSTALADGAAIVRAISSFG